MSDDAERPAVICANRDCRVAESGKCVEGLELDSCPHYGREPEPIGDDVGQAETSTGIVLSSAQTLSIEDASALLKACDSRVAALVGPRGSGKTSLIAGMYDLFQRGAIEGLEFERSQTLHAFELACHDARAASRRAAPKFERTGRGEVKFYHLQLGGGVAASPVCLALGDRAGEEYAEAADDPASIAEFPEIRRADTISLLVDGERLLSDGDRHNLRGQVILMLQAFVDTGTVNAGQHLGLVLTKLDVLEASDPALKHRSETDFQSLVGRVGDLFAKSFASISSFRVAASPTTDVIPRGTGVPAVLSFWTRPGLMPKAAPPPEPTPSRAFARLQPIAG